MSQHIAPAITRRVWLSVEEARQYTGVSARELYAALQVGELVGTQRARRKKWRIHVDNLDAWMRGDSGPA